MFTTAHLLDLIINLGCLFIWIFLLVRSVVEYVTTSSEVKRRIEELKDAEADLDEQEASNDPVTIRREHTLRSAISYALSELRTRMRIVKFNFFLWITMSVAFIMTDGTMMISMGIKLYHRECPCELTRYYKQVVVEEAQQVTNKEENNGNNQESEN